MTCFELFAWSERKSTLRIKGSFSEILFRNFKNLHKGNLILLNFMKKMEPYVAKQLLIKRSFNNIDFNNLNKFVNKLMRIMWLSILGPGIIIQHI